MENFLIDVTDDDKIIVKLADFGLAYQFKPEMPPTTKCGSLLAVAPEILTCDSYGLKVDIWGLGVILYELLTTRLPFYDSNVNKYKYNIVN